MALFSPSLEKEQTPTSPGCPRQGRFVDFLDDLGPGWDVGGRRSPARGSTHRPMCRFGLGWSSSGGRRRAPTATSRLRPGPGGSGGWCITPGQDVLDRLGLGAYDGVAEQPSLGDGGVEKACLVDVLHLCQVEPEMELLDHHGGHRLPEGPHRDFRRFVERGQSPCAAPASTPVVGTTLVHLFERLGLVNLQDSHGVQGGGCLARSTVSFGRESGCQLTGLGRETRTVPPSGRRFVGTSAPRPLSPPGEFPRTPWPLRCRG